jgi:uncharacterized surface protein with fasciclin (FAS1) repeats
VIRVCIAGKTILYMSIYEWKFISTKNSTFIWEALDQVGSVIGRSSQEFKSQSGCKYNSDLLGRSGKFSNKLKWDFVKDSAGWAWKCDNIVNKENVGISHDYFPSEAEAKQNASLFGYHYEGATKSQAGNVAKSAVAGAVSGVAGFAAVKNATTNTQHSNMSDVSTTEASSEEIDAELSDTDYGGAGDYDTKSFADDSYARVQPGIQDDGFSWGFLRWLIPLLLLLALLIWAFSFIKNTNFKTTVAGVNQSLSTPTPSRFDYKTAFADPKFSGLNGLIGVANLGDSLSNIGPALFIAPTNDAIKLIPSDVVTKLSASANLNSLQTVLKDHVIPGNVDLATLKNGSTLKSLAGRDLPVIVDANGITIDGVKIDPTKVTTSGDMKIVEATGVIVRPNLPLVDAVINRPAEPATVGKKVEYKPGRALDYFRNNGIYTILLSAVEASDLQAAVDGDGPFTIFAPTDEAFKAMPNAAELLKPANKPALQDFLKHHIVLGKNTFADFNGKNLTTLAGTPLIINTNNPYSIGQVVGPKNTTYAPIDDVYTDNAVIHIIPQSPIL